MITTVFKIQCLRLWNQPSELTMIVVVPILFFSIFAVIFGSRDRSVAGNRIKVAICDLAQSSRSDSICKELEALDSLNIYRGPASPSSTSTPTHPDQAVDWVRRGLISVAILIQNPASRQSDPNDLESLSFDSPLECQLLADSMDQVAPQVVSALMHKSLLATQFSSATLPTASTAIHLPSIDSNKPSSPNFETTHTHPNAAGVIPASALHSLPRVTVRDILGNRKSNPVIAMYAAGIAVMFLLFTASTSGGTLLDERDNGTLNRLLASQLTLDELIMGKWLFLTTQGVLQVSMMFTWGALVFGVELAQHWDGFLAMTLVTASAGSSLALLMAALCQTRNQMNWVSVVVILSMSALGGSMVPRYLMSESMQRWGWGTFNAWAIEGYQKVFWRDLPMVELWLELLVLTSCAVGFLVVARFAMNRWVRS